MQLSLTSCAKMRLTLLAGIATIFLVCPNLSLADDDWWKTAVFYQIYPRSFKVRNTKKFLSNYKIFNLGF